MILTKKQEQGLKIAITRYKNNEPYTVISGYAGTGKSTLVKFIISALNFDSDDVCYAAFTGKAATVLQQKGCQNACTTHKLLYKTIQLSDGSYRYIAKDKTEIDYKIIVIDEISMLPKNMWDLLLKYKIYVLAIGDPEQLPPVDPEQFNGVLDHPHIFLDEIVRQAQDSEIIRLSMWIREGKSLKSYNGTKEQVQIFKPNELIDGMYYWADQILCATNKKKLQINNFIRKQQGKSIYPEIGDKIISLHNHWNEFSKCKICPLTNGTIGEIKQFYVNTINLPPYISNNSIDYMMTNIEIDDNDYFEDIPIDYTGILKGVPSLTSEQEYLLKKDKRYPDPPFYFDYAYAITVHKAQGSEWDKILIIEESFPFDKIEHKQWLYTAITRAREKVVIIEK